MTANPLQILRKIILDDDRRKIEDLERTITKLQTQLAQRNLDKETLIEGLAPVITDVLQRSLVDSKDDMIEVFAPIVGPAMRQQMAEAQNEIIDALYPVIGKTIRKSVAESMKQLVDTVNRRIDSAMKGGLFLKRIQAKLTGVSEAELVIKDALPFHIDEIFLIHKSTGLLIAHVSASSSETSVDEELISGMLTAIKEFVSQAFKAPEHDLEEIQYGDHKIILEMAKYFYLAFVVSGPLPSDFSETAHKLTEKIHTIFHKKLRDFNGDLMELSDTQRVLTAAIRRHELSNKQISAAASSLSKPYLLYLLIFVGVPLALFFGGRALYGHFQDKKNHEMIVASVRNDAQLATVADQIDLQVKHGRIILSGEAPSPALISRFDSLLSTMLKIKGIDNHLRYIRPGDKILRDIEQRMIRFRNTEELHPKFFIEKDHLIIEGIASDSEVKRQVAFALSGIEGVKFVINNMSLADDEFHLLQQYLYNHLVSFETNNADLTASHFALLDGIISKLKSFTRYRLYIRGFTDDQASVEYNRALSLRRARVVADYLISKDIPATSLALEGLADQFPVASNDTEEGRRQNRRVSFELLRRM